MVTFHYVVTLIKSVLSKNINPYYFNLFLEWASCDDKSST